MGALMSSDVPTMESLISDDIVWHPPTSFSRMSAERVAGRAPVIAFLTENPAQFYEVGSRSAEELNVVSEGDLVSFHFNFRATPKIGGELCTCANWMFRLAEGRIEEVWEVLDVAEWNNAVLPR